MDIAILIPVGLAVILGLAGFAGGWRRLFFGIVIAYAAIILACQHYTIIANLDALQSYRLVIPPLQQAAIAFSFAVALAVIIIYILYILFWRPASYQRTSGGFWAALRGLGLAVVGWTLGVFLIIGLPSSLFSLFTANMPISGWLWHAARQTVTTVLPWVQPWLVEPLPSFLPLG